jgi:hypothetical protein
MAAALATGCGPDDPHAASNKAAATENILPVTVLPPRLVFRRAAL